MFLIQLSISILPRGNLPATIQLSILVNARTNRGVVDPFAVHLLGLDLLRNWVDELVVVPERRMLRRQLDALLDKELAVNILSVALVVADNVVVGDIR